MKKSILFLLVVLILVIPFSSCSNKYSDETDYNQYLKKIWVVSDWNGGAYTMCSFTISKIENGKIEGSFCTAEVALPDFYAYSFTPRLYSNNLTGTITNGAAECQFNYKDGLDEIIEGSITLVFQEDGTITATYNYTSIADYYTEFSENETYSYLFRPYNIEDIKYNTKVIYPVDDLNSWGNINVVATYYEECNHPYAMVYLMDSQNDILYEIFTLPNGHPVSDVLIHDLNGDGLKDIEVVFYIEPEYSDIIRIFYQMDNGLFYDSSLDSEYSNTEDINSEYTQTFTFQVNDNMPSYTFTAFIEPYPEWNSETTTKIVITDESSGEVIQTIIPPENDLFTKSAVYFSDVTFDGNIDLLIPFQLSAHYVTFYAYIWDEATEQFLKDSSFENIWNPVIDDENKRIIARDFSDKIASYVIILYIDREFILTNSFGFMPADNYVDKVPDADKLMHFYERKRDDDGQTIIVNDFYVLHEELSSDWINIPQLKPYYESGSFWDLDNPRWECPFHKEIKR